LDKPSTPEAELSAEVPRVTRSSIKKVPISQSSKKSKKSKEAEVSLEAHAPSSSSDNVGCHILEDFPSFSACAYVFLLCLGVDGEIRRLGHRVYSVLEGCESF
jgi:hypothetical protein